MHESLGGKEAVPHVRQPEGTELCFAAVVSAALGQGQDLDQINQALQDGYLSDDDGSTAPPFQPRAEIDLGTGQTLVMSAIQGWDREASDPVAVMENIQKKLDEGLPVALLYKKSPDPAESGMHWVLLTGYSYLGETDLPDGIVVMDPLQEENKRFCFDDVDAMVDRSMEDGPGVFAYSLEVADQRQE